MKLEESYIVGLIDGEGTISVVRYPDGRVRPQVLVFSTNREILELIKNTLEIKAPILTVSRMNDVIKSRKEMYRLQVRAKNDIKKIFEVFKRHPPIIKNKEYKKVLNLSRSWLAT